MPTNFVQYVACKPAIMNMVMIENFEVIQQILHGRNLYAISSSQK
jgi:hypothetical protein